MKRRDFLFGTGAGAIGGCATIGGESQRTALEFDLDSHLRTLDAGLATIGNPFNPLVEKELGGKHQILGDDRRLIEKSLRSLLLVGAYRDVPEPLRSDPELLRRLDAGMDDMDDSLFGVASKMEATSPAERVMLGRELRARPQFGMDFAELMGREAERVGVSMKRRVHLRSMSTQVAWRLQNQPVSLLFDQCCETVRKVEARSFSAGTESRESSGEQRPHQPGLAAIRAGAIMMGVGGANVLAAGIMGGVAAANGDGFGLGIVALFPATFGAAALLTGVITLIVGYVVKGNAEKSDP